VFAACWGTRSARCMIILIQGADGLGYRFWDALGHWPIGLQAVQVAIPIPALPVCSRVLSAGEVGIDPWGGGSMAQPESSWGVLSVSPVRCRTG